ncbi:MAG: BON domain-containing protein [Desulfamplus sp.]|nr:BON domain-containing protein [Desulfamplus sp.]
MKTTMYCIMALVAIVASLTLFSINISASDSDDTIVSASKNSYVFKTYLKNDDIQIKAYDGVVTLTGTVSEESSKALAEKTVASLNGVKSVENKLEITGKVPDADSDAWLITKVKTTLLFHRNVNAIATEILSENGTVTLRGKADSEAQKSLTTEYAMDVEGVKAVKNEMTVLNAEIKPSTQTIGQKVDAINEFIDDASITALVKTALLYHRSTSSLKITVETKEGVVSLGGNANNAAEKDLITKLATDVNGVKDVVNNMEVISQKAS